MCEGKKDAGNQSLIHNSLMYKVTILMYKVNINMVTYVYV